MPAVALRVEEPSFQASIVNYAKDVCRRCRIPRADVDDLVQAVLTEILASNHSFRAEQGDFETWTRAVVWNVIRQHARNSKRHVEHFSAYPPNLEDHPAPDPSPELCARREQARCAVLEAAEDLSPLHVRVFVLHVVHELTHVEISNELGISESNSQKCYQRTRDHLARCLSGKVFSAMPPDVIGCNDSWAANVPHSRWNEWSHYSGQVAAAIVALLLFVPSNHASYTHAAASGEIRVSASKNDAMYPPDKRSDVRDEPAVFRDTLAGKLEPASLPSVRVVATPTKSNDKPTYAPQPAPLPPYKHVERTSANRPHAR